MQAEGPASAPTRADATWTRSAVEPLGLGALGSGTAALAPGGPELSPRHVGFLSSRPSFKLRHVRGTSGTDLLSALVRSNGARRPGSPLQPSANRVARPRVPAPAGPLHCRSRAHGCVRGRRGGRLPWPPVPVRGGAAWVRGPTPMGKDRGPVHKHLAHGPVQAGDNPLHGGDGGPGGRRTHQVAAAAAALASSRVGEQAQAGRAPEPHIASRMACESESDCRAESAGQA